MNACQSLVNVAPIYRESSPSDVLALFLTWMNLKRTQLNVASQWEVGSSSAIRHVLSTFNAAKTLLIGAYLYGNIAVNFMLQIKWSV